MRKIFLILLFIPFVAFGQLEIRNTDTVWVGGRTTIVETGGFGEYYYFLNNTRTQVFSNGPIYQGIFHFTTLPSDSVTFEIWRYDGSAYDRIYKEEILSKLSEGVVDTIEFASPIYAREGDKIALKLSGGGSIGAVDLGTANSLYYAESDTILESNDVDFSTRFPNSLGYILTVKLLGRSPLAVVIGNSIAAGHTDNYSGVESSLLTVPDSAISGALYNLDTLWKVQNMAMGSTTSSYLTSNFTNYVKAIKPKYCIIESGVNDISSSVAKATYIGNMIQFLDSLENNSIIPVVLKIPPWTNGSNAQMQTRDDWMADLSDSITTRYSTAVFIDLDTTLGEFRSGGDANNLWDGISEYYTDGVHPDGTGYEKIAGAINTVINTSSSDTTIWYVATDGSDSNDGSINSEFATIQHAISKVSVGDTIYVKSGTHIHSDAIVIDPSDVGGNGVFGINGKADSLIYILGEGRDQTILDFRDNCDGFTGYNQGINLIQCEYWYFKDFTVTNVFACASNQTSGAIASSYTANMTFENINVHQVGQRGYHWLDPGAWTELDDVNAPFESDTTRWINCDVYDICDTLVNNPGNAGDGWKCHTYYGNYYYWENCRAWFYSDDGFDMSGQGERVFKNCWAMPTNKYEEYEIEGNGFKAGAVNPLYVPSNGHDDTFLHYENCLAMFGPGANSGGFYDLDYDPYQMTNGEYFNCTAYDMVYGFRSNTPTDSIETGVWRNNLSYNNTLQSIIDAGTAIYTESNNTWDASTSSYPWYTTASDVTVTNADFVTVDSTTLVSLFTAARVNNELPTFPLRLVEGSDLIDAGVDVGLSYSGTAPDIGAFEYTPGSATIPYSIVGSSPLRLNGKTLIIRQ